MLERMKAKVHRTFRRAGECHSESRRVLLTDAREFSRVRRIRAVITSPPYMNELDYVRDNRLRLWFIARELPSGLEQKRRDREKAFSDLMRKVCIRLAPGIEHGGYFLLVVGDVTRGGGRTGRTASIIESLFRSEPALGSFHLESTYIDQIPDVRRSRREYRGTRAETVLAFRKCR